MLNKTLMMLFWGILGMLITCIHSGYNDIYYAISTVVEVLLYICLVLIVKEDLC